jgi:carbonic anhydrase
MISSSEALERLRNGNRRFLSGERGSIESIGEARRKELMGGQEPFAVIVACADSRVPVEFLFDQGLGDLFVIRVAGNIVAPSQIGSVEFAATNLGTRLVVVLGHSKCGAVDAALQALAGAGDVASPNLRSIVESIRPALEPMLAKEGEIDIAEAVAANIRHSVTRLRAGSSILRDLTDSGEIKIVGAEYSIETGEVRFFDD